MHIPSTQPGGQHYVSSVAITWSVFCFCRIQGKFWFCNDYVVFLFKNSFGNKNSFCYLWSCDQGKTYFCSGSSAESEWNGIRIPSVPVGTQLTFPEAGNLSGNLKKYKFMKKMPKIFSLFSVKIFWASAPSVKFRQKSFNSDYFSA